MKPDSVATTGFGRGFNGYICYDFPLGKSNFSFAAGIGIGTSNIYLNNVFKVGVGPELTPYSIGLCISGL